jgi:hypothetical protein
MTIRGLGSRVDQALNSVTRGRQYGSEQSGSWPTAAELESGNEPLSAETNELLLGSKDLDVMRVYPGSERNDTIPSPPPELESAPWQDER